MPATGDLMSMDEFVGWISDLNAKIQSGDWADELEAAKEPIAKGFSEIFAAQQASDGSQWPPHSPVTIALHGPHDLLILTTAMYESLVTPGAPSNVMQAEGRTMEYGTSVEYAGKQNDGDDDMNIPAREFMFMTDETMDEVLDAIADHFVDNFLANL